MAWFIGAMLAFGVIGAILLAAQLLVWFEKHGPHGGGVGDDGLDGGW